MSTGYRVLLAIFLIAFVYYIWPTPYRYSTYQGLPIQINRFTHAWELLPQELPTQLKNSITLEDLKNATYIVKLPGLPDANYALHDGFYHCPEMSTLNSGYCAINLEEDKVAVGDLGGDAKEAAATVLDINTGGNTTFSELAVVVNNKGNLHNVDSKTFVYYNHTDLGKTGTVNLEWSPVIKSVSIQNREIRIEILTYGPDDAHCCPHLQKNVGYVLVGDKLKENRVYHISTVQD